jgi:hypothetical protein
VALFSDVAPDAFGKFNRAFVALFKVAAGDTWLEELPTLGPDGTLQWKPALFVCSFIILTVWVVLQVRAGGRRRGLQTGNVRNWPPPSPMVII